MSKQIKDFSLTTSVSDSDLLLIQASSDNTYKACTKNSLLDGISGSGSLPWTIKTANYTANVGEKIIADTSSNTWALTLPSNPLVGSEIDILSFKNTETNNLLIENVGTYESKQVVRLKSVISNTRTKLIYASNTLGWIQSPINLIPVFPSITLTYSSNGDDNGAFYFFGSENKTQSWTNPHIKGSIVVTVSSQLYPTLGVDSIVDRQPSDFHTNNQANPWVTFDLKTYTLTLNRWSFRARVAGNVYIPSRFIISGSNNGTTFTQLADQSFSVGQNNWITLEVSGITVGYRYIRFTVPATTYFTIGEFELYGELILI